MKPRYNVIVIGAGHNGLVAAAYLAKNGLSVLVLERSDRIGGACITREIIKGYKVSAAAQVLGMLRARIIADLELKRHGLIYWFREPEVFVPYPDGKHLFIYSDVERTVGSIARVSRRDAEAYARYDAYTTRIARIINDFMLKPAPAPGEFVDAFKGPEGPDMLRCTLFASIDEYLSRFFESDYIKGPLAYGALSGSAAGPRTPGTAYSKFYHTATGLEERFGAWALVRGGMGTITEALGAACKSYSGEMVLNAEVSEILYRAGRAVGVVLSNGSEIQSDVVISNSDPKSTFLRLLPKDAVPDAVREYLERTRVEGTGFKINFALAELPDFKALPGRTVGPQHIGGVMIAPSTDYLERAWDEVKYGYPSSSPFSHMIIQSAIDPSLAPEGKHTLSMWGHHFPYRLAQGDIDTARRQLGERMIDLMTGYAPNFRNSVIAHEVFLPVDIEETYGITGGQIFHIDMVPGRILWDRPFPGLSGHNKPVAGLYLCGAGTHPGGDVNGAPGYNAAHAVLGDFALRRSMKADGRPAL